MMNKSLSLVGAFAISGIVSVIFGGSFWAWIYAMDFDLSASFQQVVSHPISLGLGVSCLISSLAVIGLLMRLEGFMRWFLIILTLFFTPAASLPIYLVLKR